MTNFGETILNHPILIAEDDIFSRKLLEKQLTQMGMQVVTAQDGREAWEILRKEPVSIVITDWMMPEMDGIELCRKIRNAGSDIQRYIYIILLTIKGTKESRIQGIEAGADDFMNKPSDIPELKARLHTAQRVLRYEKILVERNQALSKANQELGKAHEELSSTYRLIEESLKSAGQLHEALLPAPSGSIENIRFEFKFIPCEFIAGDMFNYFRVTEDKIGFYLLDVAGHGLPAAMFSFSLSHILEPLNSKTFLPDSSENFLDFQEPTTLAASLNNMFQMRTENSRAFTMIYGVIDLTRKEVIFTQAGHPPLIFIPLGEKARILGEGGFPMGYFPNATFDAYRFSFKPGDRAYLYSDGVTECKSPEEVSYSIDRLLESVENVRDLPLGQALEQIHKDLAKWRGKTFDDDFSLLAIEFEDPVGGNFHG